MKKDIKDYLHLYLGCEIYSRNVNEIIGKLEGVQGNIIHFRVRGVWYSPKWVGYQLVLRPLSDMSEEEKKNISFDAYKVLRKEQSRIATGTERAVTWAARQTEYLLKQGFDLFGLIEAGLAIDKTKLETNEENTSGKG